MTIPTLLLRALVTGPQLLVSTTIVLALAALLPTPLSRTVLTLVLLVLGGIASGVMEGPAVRLLLRVRPAEAAERRLVTAAVARAHGATARRARVYVRRRDTVDESALALVGRRRVVVTPLLVRTLSSGLVSDAVVDGLVARAAARTEVDGASEVWVRSATLPFTLVAAVFGSGLVRLRSTSLGAVAWRLRGVLLIGILAAPASGNPHSAAAVGAAVIIGVTYVLPFAERELALRRAAVAANLESPSGSDTSWRRDRRCGLTGAAYQPCAR